MKARMTMATGLAAAALTLSACGTGGEESEPAPTTTAPSSPAPETSGPDVEVPESAADLVGEWSDPNAEWTVTFAEDGTFSEDFQGNEDFRTGDYELEDGVVSLIGGDGNTDRGSIEGESLSFRLGTLTRS
ncbi:hypothetical protein ACHAAC_15905 [Aeromicrobium sp. CF4.19]|uniref:hypothetical protein n=1 Tax=Aeromicrobium sp. CF4.19 TaxID=3373082 RepID=UPI003EE47FDD